MLTEEQKGCKRGSRGRNDLLYIDKKVLKEVKQRRKNIAMAWLDYRKAYDLIPHSWLKECLNMFGFAENVKKLLSNSMKQWCTELTAGGEEIGNVKLSRGIFKETALH